MRELKYMIFCLIALIIAIAPAYCVVPENGEMLVIAEGSAAVVNGDIAKADDEAISDAKRNAVEKALGVFVKSDTIGSDYQVAEDTILTRSEGYISEWNKIPDSRKIETIEGHELLTIKINAKVRLVNLIDDAANIEPIYNAVLRPKVMVLIIDEIDGKKSDGVGTSATAIMRGLQKRGFDVVDPEVINGILKKQSTSSSITQGSLKSASELAVNQGAEILLLGTARASDGPTDDTGNITCANAVIDARLVYADTAQLLFTPKLVKGRGVAFSDNAEARTRALNDAGNRFMASDDPSFTSQLLATWAIEVQSGRVYRIVANKIDFKDMNLLKKALIDLRGHVQFVGDADFGKQRAILNVRNRLTPQQFRDRLSGIKLGKKTIDIEESSGLVTYIKLK
ncbi:MAG: hypothetical protein NT018_11655 [Armatimonadetes bacterium]|nr:hypothetical protein [Armatimonadota bacterium]